VDIGGDSISKEEYVEEGLKFELLLLYGCWRSWLGASLLSSCGMGWYSGSPKINERIVCISMGEGGSRGIKAIWLDQLINKLNCWVGESDGNVVRISNEIENEK